MKSSLVRQTSIYFTLSTPKSSVSILHPDDETYLWETVFHTFFNVQIEYLNSHTFKISKFIEDNMSGPPNPSWFSLVEYFQVGPGQT